MSLHAALTRAKTEEDVKDAYIEALGLKGVYKGLVDIQTPEIWFEAKEAATPPLLMFAQLLVYVRAARKRGEAIPGFLCDGLKGQFPIGFLIWNLAVERAAQSIGVIALDKAGDVVGQHKFYREPPRPPLADWIIRPRSNRTPALPLNNALSPSTRTKDVRGRWWAEGAIGSLMCKGNDFQNAANSTALFSSGYNSAGAFFITSENLWQAAVVFSVRRLIKPTWLNDRDQFLQPSQPLSDEFKSDCLVWMLFNGSNLTAGADGLRWNDRDWSLTNHFIPFTEAEVGAKARFESDFMVRHLAGMTSSPAARAVLDEGRKLFQRFHATSFPKKIRQEYKLGRADAGWYQVRRALESFGDTELTDFDPFKAAYADLSAKLRPQVFELGFLPG